MDRSPRLVHEPVAASADAGLLAAYLTELAGEPFRFFRVTYGGELTVHFGDLRPAASPRLAGKPYGAYVLGTRASDWVFKPAGFDGPGGRLSVSNRLGADRDAAAALTDRLEHGDLASPDSRVAFCEPFSVGPAGTPGGGIGLTVRLADGGVLHVLPGRDREFDATTDTAEPGPDLPDWELFLPHGRLTAGPGECWTYTDGAGPPANADKDKIIRRRARAPQTDDEDD